MGDEQVDDRRLLRFGMFELDPASGELRRSGALIKLQSQQFLVLQLLAERAGQVVTREEIRRTLWDDDTFVDFDRSINFCISKIREALGDDPQSPRCIETLPRKGYRFIAPIDSRVVAAKTLAPRGGGKASTRLVIERWWPLAAVAATPLIAIAVILAMDIRWSRPTKRIESLAVLPLESLSADVEQDYFAAGITDELITALAKVSALRVIPRSSVMQYKGTRKPISQIARELGVDAVLEGTVTQFRGRVRITTQLIAAAPERHLWANKYETSLGDVMNVQDAVAKAVAREVQATITPQEQAALSTDRTINPEAHDAFLRGMYLHPSEQNVIKMRDYFQMAVDKDPEYALAWAWLAESYSLMPAVGILSRPDATPHAVAAAYRALQLDPKLALSMGTLAKAKEYEWDWEGADRQFQAALVAAPSNAAVHMDYATELAQVGRLQAAITEARRGRELAPLVYEPNLFVAWYSYVGHEYEQAESESLKLIEWEPSLPWGYICRASVYLQTRREADAIFDLQKAAALANREVQILTYLGHAYGISGRHKEAKQVLSEMISLSQHRYVPPEFIAVVYEGLGDWDRAFQWFEKAYTKRSMHPWILVDPRLDPMRSDPRFQSLMQRMGLSN